MSQRSLMYFAFKIKDGLFIGDINSPSEREFLISNKIQAIVNCASSQVKPINHNLGIKILSFEWQDSDQQIILDDQDKNISQIFKFMSDAYDNQESILVCSLRGQSRALTVITAFLMKKFKWSLYKTLEYMNSKRADFEIRATFLRQLLLLEQREFGQGENQACSKNWLDDQNNDPEAILVKNTFLNARNYLEKSQVLTHLKQSGNSQKLRKIKWSQDLEQLITDKVKNNYKKDLEPEKKILKPFQLESLTQSDQYISKDQKQIPLQIQDFSSEKQSDLENRLKSERTDDEENAVLSDQNGGNILSDCFEQIEINNKLDQFCEQTKQSSIQQIQQQQNQQIIHFHAPQQQNQIPILQHQNIVQKDEVEIRHAHNKQLQQTQLKKQILQSRNITPLRQVRKQSAPTPPISQRNQKNSQLQILQQQQMFNASNFPKKINNNFLKEEINLKPISNINPQILNQNIPSLQNNNLNPQFSININFNINQINQQNLQATSNNQNQAPFLLQQQVSNQNQEDLIKNSLESSYKQQVKVGSLRGQSAPRSISHQIQSNALPVIKDQYQHQQIQANGNQIIVSNNSRTKHNSPQPGIVKNYKFSFTENNSPQQSNEKMEILRKINNNYFANNQLENFLNEDLNSENTQEATQNVQQFQVRSNLMKKGLKRREMTPGVQKQNHQNFQLEPQQYSNSVLDQVKTDYSFFKVNNKTHFVNLEKKRINTDIDNYQKNHPTFTKISNINNHNINKRNNSNATNLNSLPKGQQINFNNIPAQQDINFLNQTNMNKIQSRRIAKAPPQINKNFNSYQI